MNEEMRKKLGFGLPIGVEPPSQDKTIKLTWEVDGYKYECGAIEDPLDSGKFIKLTPTFTNKPE